MKNGRLLYLQQDSCCSDMPVQLFDSSAEIVKKERAVTQNCCAPSASLCRGDETVDELERDLEVDRWLRENYRILFLFTL